jgi:hypothetical protein
MNTRKWTIAGCCVSGLAGLLFVVLIAAAHDNTRLTPAVGLTAMLLASAIILGGCAVIGAMIVNALCQSISEYRAGVATTVDRLAQALSELRRVP